MAQEEVIFAGFVLDYGVQVAVFHERPVETASVAKGGAQATHEVFRLTKYACQHRLAQLRVNGKPSEETEIAVALWPESIFVAETVTG